MVQDMPAEKSTFAGGAHEAGVKSPGHTVVLVNASIAKPDLKGLGEGVVANGCQA